MAAHPQAVLRIGYGLVPIVAGLDKFTNRLTDWEKYLAPAVERALPMRGRTFMKLVGVVEIAAGTLVLSRWTRLGSYLVAGWLGAIAAQLIVSGDDYDVAARDALLALGAWSLARLSPERTAKTLSPPLGRRPEPLAHQTAVVH